MRKLFIICIVLLFSTPAYAEFYFEGEVAAYKNIYWGKEFGDSWRDLVHANRNYKGWVFQVGTRSVIRSEAPTFITFNYLGFGHSQIKRAGYSISTTWGLGLAMNPTVRDGLALLIYVASNWHINNWYGRHSADLLMPGGFANFSAHFLNQVGYMAHPRVEFGIELEFTTTDSFMNRFGVYSRWEFYNKLFLVTKGLYAPTPLDNERFLALVALWTEF